VTARFSDTAMTRRTISGAGHRKPAIHIQAEVADGTNRRSLLRRFEERQRVNHADPVCRARNIDEASMFLSMSLFSVSY